MMEAYLALEKRFQRIGNLDGAAAVLQWDWAAMMPEGGAGARSRQIAELQVIRHELICDPALGGLLDDTAAKADQLDDWQRANLAEMRHRYRHATALPARLIEALASASATCEMAWREARPKDDFKAFAAAFAPLLALVREKASAKATALGLAPYDALIDGYDPGYRMAEIERIFGELEGFLPTFLNTVLHRQAERPSPLPIVGRFPIEAQRRLGLRLMEQLGFEFNHGRLDVSHHPFCGGVPEDVRITTRYDERDFARALMGVLHETGHALYERGLPSNWRGQPVGEARGMSLHESQSLLIEMQACRSLPFLRFVAPLIEAEFGRYVEAPKRVFAPENLYAQAIRVNPGFIRVDADEVTYPLHILLRYRLEKALIAGDLPLDELPGAWNQGVQDYLGITPPSAREGCLQDIHWAGGELGYFPSYTLGALTAAQFYRAACAAEPGLEAAIEVGDFTPLLGWLRRHVHGLGSRHSSPELIERASGEPLDPGIFQAHLQRRYLA
jgi:carboxypeptidase Taq